MLPCFWLFTNKFLFVQIYNINEDVVRFLAYLPLAKAKGNTICDKTLEILRRVHHFFEKFGDVVSSRIPALKNSVELTAYATGISEKTVKKAVETTLNPSDVLKPLPTCSAKTKLGQSSKRKGERLLAKLPEDVVPAIRELIHSEYGNGRKIVLKELNMKIRENYPELELPPSDVSLWRILRIAGFSYKKVNDRIILYENADLVRQRHNYLAKVKSLRDQGAYLVFMDETWFFEGYRPAKDWVDNDAIREYISIIK